MNLPSEMKIRHRFLTVSQNLEVREKRGAKLFKIECPPLQWKKKVIVSSIEKTEREIIAMTPVGGLTDDIMICLPDDEILGVMKRKVDFVTGMTDWSVIDAQGKNVIETRPSGTRFSQLMKRFGLFTAREEVIFANDRMIGSLCVKWGVAHERFEVRLEPIANQVDPKYLLATLAALSGLFYRAFT